MIRSQLPLFAAVGCLLIATGWQLNNLLSSPPRCPECATIDYQRVEQLMDKVAKAHAIQPFDVDKIKNVRGFTYAPQSLYQVELCRDTALLRQVITQLYLNTAPPRRKGLFR